MHLARREECRAPRGAGEPVSMSAWCPRCQAPVRSGGPGCWALPGISRRASLRSISVSTPPNGAQNITKDAYLKRAQSLLGGEPGGNMLAATRANGDILRYNARTNEFAVGAAEGTIRTCSARPMAWSTGSNRYHDAERTIRVPLLRIPDTGRTAPGNLRGVLRLFLGG